MLDHPIWSSTFNFLAQIGSRQKHFCADINSPCCHRHSYLLKWGGGLFTWHQEGGECMDAERRLPGQWPYKPILGLRAHGLKTSWGNFESQISDLRHKGACYDLETCLIHMDRFDRKKRTQTLHDALPLLCYNATPPSLSLHIYMRLSGWFHF